MLSSRARGSPPELFLSGRWKALTDLQRFRISLGGRPRGWREESVWLEGMINLLPQARHRPVLWGHQVVRQVSSAFFFVRED